MFTVEEGCSKWYLSDGGPRTVIIWYNNILRREFNLNGT